MNGLPIVRKAVERTVRLVSSARLRPPVLIDIVPEVMMDELFELEGATSGRLNGQWHGTVGLEKDEFVYGVPHAAFINASFAYSKPGNLNRFNDDNRGAWYAALAVETCLKEIEYHLTKELENINEFNTVIECSEMFASFAGNFLALHDYPEHDCLNPDPTIGYPAGNALAEFARSQGINLIEYPSVRHTGGTCFVALSPHVVQSVAQGDLWKIVWAGDKTPSIHKL